MTVTSTACPWRSRIERLLTTPINEDDRLVLGAHLDECSKCREHAEGLGPIDGLAEEIRSANEIKENLLVDIAPPTARLNELLTDYQILSELGRGGMGVVYKARQIKLKRLVALKVLPALLGAIRPDAMERFRREAALAAGLKHSNIISVFDFGEVDGTLYYTMELVEGRTLRDLIIEMRDAGGIGAALSIVESATDATPASHLRTGEATGDDQSRNSIRHPVHGYFRQAAQWIADVGDALHFAHLRGVVHRDMKPSNLLLSRDGRLMISDFGLARSNANLSMTVSRSLLGTSRYMAPEVVNPSLGAPGALSDVYALGATLYELLTLQPMFAATDDREVLNLVQHQEPTAPRSLVRQVPRELETICLKAIAKRPADRYASSEHLANDLRRWRLDLPIQARRPSVLARSWRFVRRRKLMVATSMLLFSAVVIAAALGISAQRSRIREERLAEVTRQQRFELVQSRVQERIVSGQFAAAIELVETALQEFPDESELKRARAIALRMVGKELEAVAILETLVLQDPKDWRSHMELATIYFTSSTRNLEKSQVHAQAFQRLKPETAEAYWLQSGTESDPEKALALLNKAIELDPNAFGPVIARAEIFEQLNRYEDELTDAQRIVALRPGWAFPHAILGQTLGRLKRFAEAEIEASNAIKIGPEQASYWTIRSDIRSGAGKFAEALADAARAIELDRTKNHAYLASAQARLGLGDADGALNDCNVLIERSPYDAEAYLVRILVYNRLGRTEDCVRDAGRVIDLLPEDPRAFRTRAICLRQLGDHKRALPDATRYVELAERAACQKCGGIADASWLRGTIRSDVGLYEEAISDFSEAIKHDPLNQVNYFLRGRLYLRTGQPDRAAADFTRVNELLPGEPDVYMLRAVAYWLMGAEREAIADLEVVAQRPGTLRAYSLLWMALILRAQQDYEAADALLASGISEWPDASIAPGIYFRYLNGELNDGTLLASRGVAQAQSMFYIGAQALALENGTSPIAFLRPCAELSGSEEIYESALARGWLRALENPRHDASGQEAPARALPGKPGG